VSALGRARAMGKPYDSACLEKLEMLFGALRHYPLQEIPEIFTSSDHFINKAFFEAYFSNYIEGTTFELKEAEEIIFEKKVPKKRPKDAHDILGTFALISDPNDTRVVPENITDLEIILKGRHQKMLARRSEAMPGKFKEKPNRAGNTHFVIPELVLGTLEKGFSLYKNLPPGLARAIYMMFFIGEVHPFADGNGRIARIMMNSELHACGLSTIIIPTVYRDDYLLALRAFSRRNREGPLVKMLQLAHKFSHQDFSLYPEILKYLDSHHWFSEPDEARIKL
jgi:Fic family protein